MNKHFLHSAWFYAALASGFFLLDLLLDRSITSTQVMILANLIYAVLVIITAYVLMNHAVQTRQRAEALLRQANEDMEKRVIERTAELARANATLQKEMNERRLAEQERERSLSETESARKRAEALAGELQMANNMLYTLIETLPVGMVITDAEGQIVTANTQAKIIMGDGLLKTANWLESAPVLYRLDSSPIPPEELPLNRAIQRTETTTGFEAMLTQADRPSIALLMAASPVRDESGRVIGAVKVMHDITEMRQAEEALLQVQAELAEGMRERAALEERQRLARELHDSVSQALYGIALGTHTALTLFDSDRAKVMDALNFVLSLAQAGLTEMRALIFELRPESLQVEGLVSALSKQTAAIQARYGIEVELTLCDEPGIPLTTKEALYRIAQEALQNAIKHARANRLVVRLLCEADRLRLEICDNGIGFDPQAAFPGHLGLQSMRERAKGTGGALAVTSAPDCGTQIVVSIPLPGRQIS